MPKEINKRYVQKYTKCWETDPDLKDWLGPDPTDSSSATCKYCRVTLKAHKKDLLGHSKTDRHKKSVEFDKCAKSCKELTLKFQPILSDKTKIAEFKIVASIAEPSSSQTEDHMNDMSKMEIKINKSTNDNREGDFQEIEERMMESVRRSSSEVEEKLKNWWRGELERINAESEDRARKLCAEELEKLRANNEEEEEEKHCIYCMKNQQTILETESAMKELKENFLGEKNAWDVERRLLLEVIGKLSGKESGGDKGERILLLKMEEKGEEDL